MDSSSFCSEGQLTCLAYIYAPHPPSSPSLPPDPCLQIVNVQCVTTTVDGSKYATVPPSSSSPPSSASTATIVGATVGVIGGVVVLGAAVVAFLAIRNKKRKDRAVSNAVGENVRRGDLTLIGDEQDQRQRAAQGTRSMATLGAAGAAAAAQGRSQVYATSSSVAPPSRGVMLDDPSKDPSPVAPKKLRSTSETASPVSKFDNTTTTAARGPSTPSAGGAVGSTEATMLALGITEADDANDAAGAAILPAGRKMRTSQASFSPASTAADVAAPGAVVSPRGANDVVPLSGLDAVMREASVTVGPRELRQERSSAWGPSADEDVKEQVGAPPVRPALAAQASNLRTSIVAEGGISLQEVRAGSQTGGGGNQRVSRRIQQLQADAGASGGGGEPSGYSSPVTEFSSPDLPPAGGPAREDSSGGIGRHRIAGERGSRPSSAHSSEASGPSSDRRRQPPHLSLAESVGRMLSGQDPKAPR